MTKKPQKLIIIVMSSLKTCNMNSGSRWEGRGRVGSKGWLLVHKLQTMKNELFQGVQARDFQVLFFPIKSNLIGQTIWPLSDNKFIFKFSEIVNFVSQQYTHTHYAHAQYVHMVTSFWLNISILFLRICFIPSEKMVELRRKFRLY